MARSSSARLARVTWTPVRGRCVGRLAVRGRGPDRQRARTATSRCCSRTATSRSAPIACPTPSKVAGTVGLNYHVAPRSPSPGMADPPTPLLEALPGDPLRIHVLAPFSEQAQVFSIEGYAWPSNRGPGLAHHRQPALRGPPGTGPRCRGRRDEPMPGDYVYGDHRMPYRRGRTLGILRVHDPDVPSTLRPLPCSRRTPPDPDAGHRSYPLSSYLYSRPDPRRSSGYRRHRRAGE